MIPAIVPIVEGFSEVESVPVLLRRLLAQRSAYNVEVAKPVRVPRYGIVRPGELERALKLAALRPGCQAILLLLDADDDCPKTLAPELLVRMEGPAIPNSVVLAKAELESWFVGAVESIRGARGIRLDATPPPDPEAIRDAKKWLTQAMGPTRSYQPRIDQPALIQRFDLDLAATRCPSFAKFLRDFDRLVQELA